eukprot:1107474-Pelagomonas_calceolata.AAC.1
MSATSSSQIRFASFRQNSLAAKLLIFHFIEVLRQLRVGMLQAVEPMRRGTARICATRIMKLLVHITRLAIQSPGKVIAQS